MKTIFELVEVYAWGKDLVANPVATITGKDWNRIATKYVKGETDFIPRIMTYKVLEKLGGKILKEHSVKPNLKTLESNEIFD